MNLFDVCFSFVLDCAAMSSVVFCCLVLDKNINIFITANYTAAKELKNMCKLNLFLFLLYQLIFGNSLYNPET